MKEISNTHWPVAVIPDTVRPGSVENALPFALLNVLYRRKPDMNLKGSKTEEKVTKGTSYDHSRR
jgi:hypothetical protein